MRMNYSKFLYVVTFATVLFTACGNDSSTSANNSNDNISSKSSSSQRSVSSSSNKVTEPVEVTVGSMKDSRDGHTYKTVTIGSQTWMAENLNYETANSYCYNDNASNCTKYGRLYSWAAAVGRSESDCGYGYACPLPSGNIQGVCPSGWHLPTRTEWNTLFNAVGGYTVAGTKLKSTSGWYNSGNGTEAFSFSALPAGYRDDLGYSYEGFSAYFWSSTEYGSYYAYIMYLGYYNDDAYLDGSFKNYGFSVRCLQD